MNTENRIGTRRTTTNSLARITVASLIAITIVALLVVASRRQEPPPLPHLVKEPAPTQRAVYVSNSPRFLPVRGIAGFSWQTGDTASFDLRVAFWVGPVSDSASLPDAASQGLVIQGVYHLGVVSVTGENVTLAAALSQSKVMRGGERSPILEEMINTTSALLTLKQDGTIQEIAFPGEVPTEDRDILRAIFGWEFQARPGELSWQSTEAVEGDNGKFLATYTANQDGSMAKVRSFVPGSQGPVQQVKASRFDAKAGRCWVDYLRGQECSLLIWQGQSMGESFVSVSLERSTGSAIPAHLASIVRAGSRPNEFTAVPSANANARPSASEQLRRESLEQKYRSMPYEIPLAALQRVANTGTTADAIPALQDLRDMLTVRPEVASQVAESLKSPMTPELSGLLAHSLESANTEATHGALADILSKPDDYAPNVLAQAIVAAGGLGQLKDPRVAESLTRMLNYVVEDPAEYSLNYGALYSLGRLAVANPELQAPLISALTPRLEEGDNEAARSALLALANGHLESPAIVGRAESLLRSQDPHMRTAALTYLQQTSQLSAGQTQEIIGLLKDPSVGVQLQVVDTLSQANRGASNAESLAALQAVAADGTADQDVREAALLALTNRNQKPSERSTPQ